MWDVQGGGPIDTVGPMAWRFVGEELVFVGYVELGTESQCRCLRVGVMCSQGSVWARTLNFSRGFAGDPKLDSAAIVHAGPGKLGISEQKPESGDVFEVAEGFGGFRDRFYVWLMAEGKVQEDTQAANFCGWGETHQASERLMVIGGRTLRATM